MDAGSTTRVLKSSGTVLSVLIPLLAAVLVALACVPADRPADGAERDPDQGDYVLLALVPGDFSQAPGSYQGRLELVYHDQSSLDAGDDAWARVMEAVSDPATRAVVVPSAPEGSSGLFEAIRAARDDIVIVAGGCPDDTLALEAFADLVVDLDWAARSKAAGRAAALLDASSILLVGKKDQSPTWERDSRRGALASSGLALSTADVDIGPQGQFDAAALKGLLQALEPGTAVIPDHPWLARALADAAMETGSLYIEGASLPWGQRYGQAQNYLDAPKAADTLALERASVGRMLFWPGDAPDAVAAALVRHTLLALDRGDGLRDGDALAASLRSVWPAGSWKVEPYLDPDSGIRARGHLMISSDPYLAGRGYLPSARKDG